MAGLVCVRCRCSLWNSICRRIKHSMFCITYGKATRFTISGSVQKWFSSDNSSGPWRILFYGTDNFSLKALRALNENRVGKTHPTVVKHLEVVCVKNIRSVVECYAKDHNLPLHHWPYKVPLGQFDVGVVSSFGHLIPEESIKACHFGMLNIHGSLLPRWRGAAPIVYTILNRDKVAGVTIMEIAPRKYRHL